MDFPTYGVLGNQIKVQSINEQRVNQRNVPANGATPPLVVQPQRVVAPQPDIHQQAQQQTVATQEQTTTDTTVRELNDFDPFLVFKGKENTISIHDWFKRIEDTFKPNWTNV